MKEQEFVSLLQSHPECLFDEKKFRAILSDLFPRDVQMNNILVNLFHLGLPREIEELQVIGDPVYYKYKKKVVKIYGIDHDYYGAAEPPVRWWRSHLSGLSEPPRMIIGYLAFSGSNP